MLIIFIFLLKTYRRGGSNEYPQSKFLSKNKKNNIYPCKPKFYYIEVGFKGSKLYRHVFVMYSRSTDTLYDKVLQDRYL